MDHTDVPIPDWARAHGAPICKAIIRANPADFYVEESLGVQPSDDGEHDLLLIKKTGANTNWLARQLAKFAGIASSDVGFSGLKDRNAVTRQTFSVRRPTGAGTDWSAFDVPGVEILQIARHNRKIRRGTHKHNTFAIRLRGTEIVAHRNALASRIEVIAQDGVPNYFGEQRFGREGRNVMLARSVLAGKRVKREQRGIAISAARSLIFNAILDVRVRDESWQQILDGELVNLDGSASVFSIDTVTADLQQRCRERDIHPTATLWGAGAPLSSRRVATLEQAIASDYETYTAGLIKARVSAGHRPLRLLASDLRYEFGEDGVLLSFGLPRGAYATALLRELVQTGLE